MKQFDINKLHSFLIQRLYFSINYPYIHFNNFKTAAFSVTFRVSPTTTSRDGVENRDKVSITKTSGRYAMIHTAFFIFL